MKTMTMTTITTINQTHDNDHDDTINNNRKEINISRRKKERKNE